MVFRAVATLLALTGAVSAWDAPQYAGFNRVWQDNFSGAAGTLPDRNGQWTILEGDLGVNNELQFYTRESRTIQLSGGDTLQVVPWRDGSKPKGWVSGRAESNYVFTPKDGAITRGEAALMFGDSPQGNKQGIWPAFWSLGDSIRHGTGWPACGEIDIMETVNGQLTGHGTLHCDVYPGGICNEGTGIGSPVGIPNYGWHTWRVDIDRRNGDFRGQSITWYLDGQQFHQVTGDRIGNADVWRSIAQSPLFFITNVAVGGSWPGNPDGATQDGYGVRLELGYVAHYET
ncbi:hypothetical protein N3K66_002875 [Trichothecium roseum]|uniref:Uncharacterized protein n=1 Tax=Trichothecium roseum TaxID=47278 RepID=A0ACC0V3V2_9HYPO|nr:hypothetical protein N3K66_002875 [Trichothecium roseum]